MTGIINKQRNKMSWQNDAYRRKNLKGEKKVRLSSSPERGSLISGFRPANFHHESSARLGPSVLISS